jgi:hypothetical protein
MKIISVNFLWSSSIVLFLFLSPNLYSQQKSFDISGKIVSNETDEPLESATIYLERERDSTLVTYTISDRNGHFNLKGRTYEDSVNLYISYLGYLTKKRKIKLEENTIDLSTLRLIVNDNTLDEIIIRSRAPITIKRDTLEFNVSSFRTREGATVEELLKELPGVEVDAEGNITVNGKPVNKLLVNGKPFFGDDPTIATRNLTKEMIEKVQVMDTKTDAEAFAGEEGDQENKTINLTISEEKNKGSFGRLSAGGGTNKRYESAGILNRFDNDTRISVLAGGNNTNSPGFSFGEIQKMFGGGSTVTTSSGGGFTIDGRSFGLGSGIVKTRNAGANYADSYSKSTDISVDYFYGGADSDDEIITERENIFPDTRFFTNSLSVNKTSSDVHSANVKFDIKVDTTWLINIKPSFSFSEYESMQNREEQTSNEFQELTNQSVSNNTTNSTARNFKNAVDVTRKFGTKGGSVRVSLNYERNEVTGRDYLLSETEFFDENIPDDIRNQTSEIDQSLNSYYATFKYSIPIISKKLFFDINYSYRTDTRSSIRTTQDFNFDTEEYDLFNEQLSTDFKFTNNRSTPGVGMTLREENYTLSFSLGYVTRILESNDRLRPSLSARETFEELEYNTFLSYRFSPQKSLFFNYSMSSAPPTLEQLQPFENVSDPLNTVIGNPDLEPSNTHQMYLGYNAFDFQSGTGFNIFSNFRTVNNQVTPVITFDENLIRTTTYTNVNGNYNGYLGGNFTKDVQLDSIHKIKFSVGGYGSFNKVVSFNNNKKFSSDLVSLTPSLGFTYTWKDVMELRPGYSLGYSINSYDIETFDNEKFFTHRFGIQTATFLPKKLEWRNDINFIYNPNVADNFQRSAWFWNSTLAYTILKDQGILTLKVYDLLNQNTNARRSVSQNYIQDVQSKVLQQYFMLSFSWKFNSLGQKGETNSGGMFRF